MLLPRAEWEPDSSFCGKACGFEKKCPFQNGVKIKQTKSKFSAKWNLKKTIFCSDKSEMFCSDFDFLNLIVLYKMKNGNERSFQNTKSKHSSLKKLSSIFLSKWNFIKIDTFLQNILLLGNQPFPSENLQPALLLNLIANSGNSSL